MRRPPERVIAELASAKPRRKGSPKRSLKIGWAAAGTGTAAATAVEQHLEQWRRNMPTHMDIPVVTGGVIRYRLSPRDIAQRKAMDKDGKRQLARRRKRARDHRLARQSDSERELLRKLRDAGI